MVEGGEVIGKVFVAGEISAFVAQDDLVKVDGFVEFADGGEGFGVLWVEGKGVGEVEF